MTDNKPTLPIRPTKPNMNTIKPKKEKYSANVSIGRLLLSFFFLALAVGIGIFAFFFYTGKLNDIPVLGFLTTFIYIFCYTSGLLSIAALLFGLFLLIAFIVSVVTQFKLNKKYKNDLEYYDLNKDAMLEEALKKYEEDLKKYKIAEKQYNKKMREYANEVKRKNSTKTSYSSYDYHNTKSSYYSTDNSESYEYDEDVTETNDEEIDNSEDYHRIYNSSWSIIGFYKNGFVMNSSYSVIGEYRNGYVDYYGSLYGEYDSSGTLYKSGQRIGRCEYGFIYDEYGQMIGKYDGDTEGACAAALLILF